MSGHFEASSVTITSYGVIEVDDSSTNRLPACDGVVPGSIPGLAFSFSSYRCFGHGHGHGTRSTDHDVRLGV